MTPRKKKRYKLLVWQMKEKYGYKAHRHKENDKGIIKEYYEQLSTHASDNLGEMH